MGLLYNIVVKHIYIRVIQWGITFYNKLVIQGITEALTI